MENKNHWYDGMFYDKVIAPNQDEAFEEVRKIINKYSNILDVGCGTGRMAARLSDKYGSYTGIDLSIRNIDAGRKKLTADNPEKIKFIHADAYTYLQENETRYDYAVLSYVVHEIDEPDRVPLLRLLSRHAERIIIVDYLVPRSGGFRDFINGVVEFIAGREHYRNFKSYVLKGGLRVLAGQSGLKVVEEIVNKPITSHIGVLERA